MSTHRNGRHLEEQTACEQGLLRRIRARKSKRDEIYYYFELMRRIRNAARRMSRRDDELIEAVVRHQTLTDAARNLAPENAEALRSYMSQRLRTFKELARLFFEESIADSE
jgi:hypothetical protein